MASSEHVPVVGAAGDADPLPLWHVVDALRRHWWLPVAGAIVAAGLALLVGEFVSRGQASTAHYDAQALVTVQDDPLVYHTYGAFVKSYDPAWVPIQIGFFAGTRARALAAREAGVREAELSDALSVRSLGGGAFAISLSDLPKDAAERSLAAVLDTFRLLRRDQVRTATTAEIARLDPIVRRLQRQLDGLLRRAPKSTAALRLSNEVSTFRAEIANDQTLRSVLPTGLSVGSTSVTSRTKIVDPLGAAFAGLIVGLVLGCFAALIAGGLKSKTFLRAA